MRAAESRVALLAPTGGNADARVAVVYPLGGRHTRSCVFRLPDRENARAYGEHRAWPRSDATGERREAFTLSHTAPLGGRLCTTQLVLTLENI